MRAECPECGKEEPINSWEQYQQFRHKHDHAVGTILTNLEKKKNG